ncbi:unnamed protein product [Lepeophtheirus salmonis]|uniref:(salmon louse) hypothetical protein n=1 Tax=Lepeophtheirus salmonis TaxID=72036 RepID=A0A7R8D7A9_LEPSM|nr:unnamed protein product [Lepeophtheirus salmonis]CAF3024143.1 unnamed protein product [Lepeophtheirus salmonis]
MVTTFGEFVHTHFHNSCFGKERKDSLSTGAKKSKYFSKEIPRLKLGAVATKFPKALAYLSKLPVPQRSTFFKKESKMIDKRISDILEEDAIHNFGSIKKRF